MGYRIRSLALFALTCIPVLADGPVSAPAGTTGGAPAIDGLAVDRAKCATCHGEKGDGQGSASYLLYPRPRNFVSGSFRLRCARRLRASLPRTRTSCGRSPAVSRVTSMPGWSTELSDPELRAMVDVVKSFSERLKMSPPAASSRSRGVYGDRSWRVLVRRALATSDAGDVQLAGLKAVPVSFGVWDGSQRDRNGQKLFSAWQTLVLEP